ncbi:MAG: polysaccharide deacetylase family protein [Nonlabens sp.]|uniref:polysaccharide deacetylase family protein n=1 Tax=Nonlabens sp. TaxID=1888209 RepID=UPI003EFB0A88
MHWYPDTIKDWFSSLFTGYQWHGSRNKKIVHLTFDDGPHPVVTPFVLNELKKHQFEATFFCIGDCVQKHPEVYEELLQSEHAVGNHTFHHLNSWKTSTITYLTDVKKAGQVIDSKLFRPPYGRIKSSVARGLRDLDYKIVMWDVLSGDFDNKRTSRSCLINLKKNTKNGSIIVFHDSEKAYEKLKEILPEYFKFLKKEGFQTAVIKHTASTT